MTGEVGFTDHTDYRCGCGFRTLDFRRVIGHKHQGCQEGFRRVVLMTVLSDDTQSDDDAIKPAAASRQT